MRRSLTALSLVAGLLVASCSGAAPTPQIVYVTPEPTTGTKRPDPTPLIVYVTPAPTPTPKPSPGEASATPGVTAASAAPTPPTPRPTAVPPKAQSVTLSGSTSGNTKAFRLSGGEYSILFTLRGAEPTNGCLVGLQSTGDGYDYLLVNEIVDSSGVWKYANNVYDVAPGRYYLHVFVPGGRWSITIKSRP